MKNLVRASVLTLLVLSSTYARSSAAIVYTLHDVQLKDMYGESAGALTGTFTLNDARDSLLAANIVAPETTGLTFNFAEVNYTQAGSVHEGFLPDSFRIDLSGSQYELQLVFASPLSTSGITNFITNGPSSEHQWNAGNRLVTSGYVTASSGAVPEPSAIAMAAVAAGAGLATALRARRRRGGVQVS